jgi:hypothetical protein
MGVKQEVWREQREAIQSFAENLWIAAALRASQ